MTTLPEHSRQHDHYRVDCGVPSPNGGKVDYALTTKCGQGDIFYENGNHEFVADSTSKETVGRKITDEWIPAKIIEAQNGGIHLYAPNGTITIEAANIRFIGVDGLDGGEITFQASKLIHMDAPTITAQGTNVTMAAAQIASVVGTAGLDLATSTKATCASGVETDSSSIFAQLFSAITKFKKFFSSICAD